MTTTSERVYRSEVQKTHDLYAQTGLTTPAEVLADSALFLVSVSSVYIPGEAQVNSRRFSPASEEYIKKEVQPELRNIGSRPASKEVFKELGRQTGRALMAGMRAGLIRADPPMDIQHGRIAVDGQRVEFDRQGAEVIEFGMGLNGFAGLADTVRDHDTRVTAVHKSQAETHLISGMVDFNGGGDITLLDGGIKKNLRSLSGKNADLLVASRVHMAGDELRLGLAAASKIVRPNGLVIARGPTILTRGMSYNNAAKTLGKDPNLEIISDIHFANPGTQEANRSILAQRIQ